MSDQKPKIGKKNAGRKIARELAEQRRKPLSQEVLDIVDEISERNQKGNRKVARPHDAEM